MTYDTMTEDRIERIAEREMDVLDRALMRGNISPEDYEQLVVQLTQKVSHAYSRLVCFN